MQHTFSTIGHNVTIFTAITEQGVVQLNAKSVQAATQALKASKYDLLSIVPATLTETED